MTNSITCIQKDKYYYKSQVNEPKDMVRILSDYYSQSEGKSKMTNAMRRGFRMSINEFSNEQLLLYVDTQTVKLVDVINLVHPIPNNKNSIGLSEITKSVKT